ncbi:MAG: hypothetical protein A2452_13590 [Candidatus Firestonebacteria bacterium RIFOXYC2_FULL_39_67]|nr:MAG: hypothetical protein A2497_06360 [Candidatus Firestonebacteria bacterium RifOxyC12_full_39_7]OGF56240.1 MAG: hypothetical protein A2452_13590 [Candidatus Firestonebacteria bacterium RIFOXYC2_FULL_39_67]
MKYNKTPLTFEAQADLLSRRGLIAEKTVLIDRLKNVNYYRLSGYLYPYRNDDHNFKPGTTLEKIWRHYTFDRRLRLIVMDAIERVEVSLRAQLIYGLAHSTGAFGYTEIKSLPQLKLDAYMRWAGEVKHEIDRSHETFVKHFKAKYGDTHEYLSLWMTGEIISFGCTLTMYRGASIDIKKRIAEYYGISDNVLTSWLQTINVIRNICAHHSRLWNRELGVKPYIPRKNKYPQWHFPVPVLMSARVLHQSIVTQIPAISERLLEFFEVEKSGYMICKQNIDQIIEGSDLSPDSKRLLVVLTQTPYRVFVILSILQYFLKIIAPQSGWKTRLMILLDEYPEVSRWSMGFPENWKDCKIWKL